MKELIFGVVALCVSLGALAEITSSSVVNAGFSKLSEAEKAEVVRMVAEKSSSGVGSVEKIDKYVQIGSNIGKGLASTAKEVGVAVNEFATTPVGIVAMMLLVWNMMGKAIIMIALGVSLIVFGPIIIRRMYRGCVDTETTYSPDKTDIFGRARLVKHSVEGLSTDAFTFYILLNIVCIFTGTAVLLNV